MIFEYDRAKSLLNKDKHGIDFEAAQALWDDENYLEFPTKEIIESRFLVIGMIAGKCWSAIVTYRGDKIRIISVRRARKDEKELYENF